VEVEVSRYLDYLLSETELVLNELRDFIVVGLPEVKGLVVQT
jgi:hypothetical protein